MQLCAGRPGSVLLSSAPTGVIKVLFEVYASTSARFMVMLATLSIRMYLPLANDSLV
jgi:hypothetical protein